MPIVPNPPWYFSLGKWMLKHDIRGGWRSLSMLHSRGALDKACWLPFLDGTRLLVPLSWQWIWTHDELSGYEPTTLENFARWINRAATGPFLFLDCGAHIGLVSHYIAHRCPNVREILAFEPSAELQSVLGANCANLPRAAQALSHALDDYTGRAALIVPQSGGDDGAYVARDGKGAVDVRRVDDLALPADCGIVMKIDVEGAEPGVLRGAAATLARAPFFVVMYEAHSAVAKRTGVDPIECIRFLNELRPVRWAVTSDPGRAITLDRPFFSQISDEYVRNVVVSTEPFLETA